MLKHEIQDISEIIYIDFTARRHALARSLLSAGVHLSVRHVRVLYCIQTAEDIIRHVSRPGGDKVISPRF